MEAGVFAQQTRKRGQKGFHVQEPHRVLLHFKNSIQQCFPHGPNSKEPACHCRKHKRHGFNPWIGKMPWRKERLPTPVFWSGDLHGLCPWGGKNSDTTEQLNNKNATKASIIPPLPNHSTLQAGMVLNNSQKPALTWARGRGSALQGCRTPESYPAAGTP